MPKKKRPKVNLAPSIKPKSGELEQLFMTDQDIEQSAGLQLLAIRVDAIQPDRGQPRKTFVDETLADLSESIRQDGVIQPIEVAEIQPGHYLIVHGERRWRAAKMAGLQTIPAIVRRRDYDEVTRFVRQLVENMQREDLNDVDRAKSMKRLKMLMEEELARAKEENISRKEPWGKTITWAKVAERLGYSRQRVSQLTNVLKLDEVIQEDIREGQISERETRVYQGLRPSQQRALHRERQAGTVSDGQVKQIVRYLKDNPDSTVTQVLRLLNQPPPPDSEDAPLPYPDNGKKGADPAQDFRWEEAQSQPMREADPSINPGTVRVDSVKRLDYVRGHLARVERKGLKTTQRKELLRLLHLIQKDVDSLIKALEEKQ